MELKKTGQWVWRINELSHSQFVKLSNDDKKIHIEYLISIGEDNLSTNDWYIMTQFAPNHLNKKAVKFLQLDDDNSSVLVSNVDIIEISYEEELKQLPQRTTKELREYLNNIYWDYPNWIMDLKQSKTSELYINNTRQFYNYSILDIATINILKTKI